ncbi:MAG: HDOD domain-containing protein [Acidobacteriota bacterium]|nr:HDOD domain-containing protein [Acidobacteriota bacterium]
MFWSRWTKKRRAKAVEREKSRTATAVATPPNPAPPNPAPHPPAATGGWFSKAEIAALKDVQDDRQLAQIISRQVPGADREEVLFRHSLSRAIYLGEYDLPILPQAAAQVMELSTNPRAEVGDYVTVIESDHSLVRAIVDTANSSFFASLSGSATLEQAIVRIGLRQVDQITMIHALRSKVFRVAGFEEMTQRVVKHSLASAVAARVVAEALGEPHSQAFLGGLFHDVGKLVILGLVGQVQRKLDWAAPHELVESAFDAYHVFTGSSLCTHWNFPEALSRGIANHHDPDQAAAQRLDQAIYLGNLLAHSLAAGDGSSVCAPEDPVLVAAAWTPARLEEIRADVLKHLEAYKALGF